MSGQGLRAPRPPRAFLLATGEEIPAGHSLRARLLVLELRLGEVNRPALTRCQEDAEQGQFALAMGGYLEWIAARYEEIQNNLKTRVRELRDQNHMISSHARLPGMLAELMGGWQVFLQFALEAGAIDGAARANLEERGQRAFVEVAAMQARYHQASDPALRFMGLLQAALVAGAVHVAGRNGGAPENPERWGWQSRPDGFLPKGERIGWIVGSDLFLEPTASYHAAQRMAGSERLPIGARTLRHRLHEQNLLLSVDAGREMLLVRRVFDGCSRQVLHLNAADVVGLANREDGPL